MNPELIREFRKRNNLTQRDLAKIVGVSMYTISRSERGLGNNTNNHKIMEAIKREEEGPVKPTTEKLNIRKASRIFNINPSKISKLIKTGALPFKRKGKGRTSPKEFTVVDLMKAMKNGISEQVDKPETMKVPEFIDSVDAAGKIGVPESMILEAIDQGYLSYKRIGRKSFISVHDIASVEAN